MGTPVVGGRGIMGRPIRAKAGTDNRLVRHMVGGQGVGKSRRDREDVGGLGS